ncbi:hypothetical protein BDV96DRAFT_635959 [Lophiotrema nucula]|uniref:Uncharacterized protein n=1 Tax=Lophiotrema nucula TaxID=690887 RepID=A0A6A5YRG3_9PLEO|nr:hypothetical protein BDV96DRAFT_635959 [Lophiotrema nucula]
MARHALLAGWTPSIMILSFLAGMLLAFGHHLFYASLRDRPTTSVSLMSGRYKGQQLTIAIGTALAFLVQAAFVLAVSTAYYQIFWAYIKRDAKSNNPPTLGRLDTVHSASSSIISLLTVPVWFHYPLLFFMALTVWLIPIAAVVPPATLSVALRENITSTSMEDAPQLNFSSFNFLANMPSTGFGSPSGDTQWFEYNGPSLHLTRTALSVAIQQSILPIEPPFQKTNSSWTVNFNAPSLQCDPASPDRTLAVQKNIAQYLKQDCMSPASFLAWYPRLTGKAKDPVLYLEPYYTYTNASGLFFEAEAMFHTDIDSTTGYQLTRKERAAEFYISIMPGMTLGRVDPSKDPCLLGDSLYIPTTSRKPLGSLADNSTMLVCKLYNSTYRTTFDYTNNLQVINTEVEQGPIAQIVDSIRGPMIATQVTDGCATFNKNPDDKAGKCEHDPTLLSQLAYQSILQAFTTLFTGNITLPYQVTTIVLSGTSSIRDTPLIDTKELAYLTNFDSDMVSQQIEEGPPEIPANLQAFLAPNSTTNHTSSSDRLLGKMLEDMFRNFTISLLSSPLYLANTSSPTALPKVQVTHATTEIIYVYRADTLWAAYGAAAFCTLVSVLIGFLSIFICKAPYSNSFSTIFRFAKGAELSTEIVGEDLDGKSPLPRYLEQATVRLHSQAEGDVEMMVVETKVDGSRTMLLEDDEALRSGTGGVAHVDNPANDRGTGFS